VAMITAYWCDRRIAQHLCRQYTPSHFKKPVHETPCEVDPCHALLKCFVSQMYMGMYVLPLSPQINVAE
jgi:hypothetical protein